MRLEQIHQAILEILRKAKDRNGQGLLSRERIEAELEKRFGEKIDTKDVRYSLDFLNNRGLIKGINTEQKGIVSAVITIDGESVARNDYTPPAPAVQNNYSINVSGGTVGPITQGVIHNLQMTINQLPDKDYESLKNSLQAMMDAVINSNEFAEDAQADTLNYLQALAEQVSQPPEKRNLTIARVALTAIPAAIGFSSDLIGLWESDLAQPLLQALGLS